MYPCNNQACIKEKHFKLFLSPALAKWAWLQPAWCLGPLYYMSLLLAGDLCTPTPPFHSSPRRQSPWGSFLREGWCSFHDPQHQFAVPSHREGVTQSLSFPCALFLSLHPATREELAPKNRGRMNGDKGEMYFPWPISNLFYTTHLRRTPPQRSE